MKAIVPPSSFLQKDSKGQAEPRGAEAVPKGSVGQRDPQDPSGPPSPHAAQETLTQQYQHLPHAHPADQGLLSTQEPHQL